MQTIYRWNDSNIYFQSFDVDPEGDLPARSTFTAPPEIEGDQVAQWNGEAWEVLDSAPHASAPDWAAQIAAWRYTAEIAGTTIDGMPIDTGRDSQSLITGAAVQAIIDPAYSLHWKTSAGFVELTGQQILGVASMVRAYVQGCFNREAVLLGAVADGSITAEMLEEGWPE